MAGTTYRLSSSVVYCYLNFVSVAMSPLSHLEKLDSWCLEASQKIAMGSGCSTSSMASQFEELTAMARHRKIEESIEQDQVHVKGSIRLFRFYNTFIGQVPNNEGDQVAPFGGWRVWKVHNRETDENHS